LTNPIAIEQSEHPTDHRPIELGKSALAVSGEKKLKDMTDKVGRMVE
jgi:hypothetical protein